MNEIEKFPLMHNGYLIVKKTNHATVHHLAHGVSFNVKFKKWAVCKRFIDELRHRDGY